MENEAKQAILKLLAYCRACDWAGYEPYDVLNSRVVAALPLMRFRLPRLVLTQALKRSPVNVRPLLGIPKTQNPKALAIFLSAFLKLAKTGIVETEGDVDLMIERLIALRSPGVPYSCWGYSFPWQTRTDLVPRWSPNVVCTSFVADALLDAYEERRDARCLEMAVSAAEYILNDLFWEEGEEVGFCYPLPTLRARVHNANLIGAALFCRVYKHTGEEKFLCPALRAARYSAAKQLPDGRWDYGELPTQRWTDNFHTGYNLCALDRIGRELQTREFEPHLRRGYEFYKARFYLEDGSVRYYHDRTYPIDTHCVAQSIITPLVLRDREPDGARLARLAFRWVMDHMWDERGFFYYRVLRSCTIRTSYLRWTQCWMFLALATLLCEEALVRQPEADQAAATAGR